MNPVKLVNYINYVNSLLLALCSFFCFLIGCASLQQQGSVLAVVNGEPITEEDLKYSLTIAHRKEDLSSAGELNLTQYIQKLVDDKLIVQEAQRMGMEDYPEIQQAVQAYILRESVVRLYNEEVVSKVEITEEDINNYYKKNYERVLLGIIEVDSAENGQEILLQLQKEADFKELAQKYSKHPSQKDGGEVILRRNSLAPSIEMAVSNLKPGEFSDVLEIKDKKYYIIKFIRSEEAPDSEIESVRKSIERVIRKQKEKERGDEYLKYLRERMTIRIDNEIFSSMVMSEESKKEELSQDERIFVQVNGATLTVKDFMAIATPYPKKSKETLLNDWIDRKVVDHEALNRHYETITDLKDMVYRYKNQLFKSTFIKKIIIPQIVLSDEALKNYYSGHQGSFMEPTHFKIQQITVNNIDVAQDILNNLQHGADFAWLAKRHSTDSLAQEGGNLGWTTMAEMPEPVRKTIGTLKVGDISPVIKIDSWYRIIQLLDKKNGELEDFDKVRKAVYKAAFEEQLDTLLQSYVAQLKADSEITINDKAVRLLEEKVQE